MSDEATFIDFIRRIRAGDEQAARELVERYEPLVRREVRLQIQDRRLYRLFDSIDVCQNVMASFFLRCAAGEYDFERPEQLLQLLSTMARNKLASAVRHQHRQRRDNRRVAADGGDALNEIATATPTPSQIVAGKELLERFHRSLSTDERQLADLRAAGMPWTDIAAQLGGAPQARRMQLARAVERVLHELGLDEALDD